jgi:hypothetical protein
MSRFNPLADVRGQGRSLAQIADAYGAPLPSAVRAGAAPSRHTEAGLVHSTGSARGFMGRARGWSPVPHPLVVYRASTAEIGGVFPFVGAQALPPTGASVGVDNPLRRRLLRRPDALGAVRDHLKPEPGAVRQAGNRQVDHRQGNPVTPHAEETQGLKSLTLVLKQQSTAPVGDPQHHPGVRAHKHHS